MLVQRSKVPEIIPFLNTIKKKNDSNVFVPVENYQACFDLLITFDKFFTIAKIYLTVDIKVKDY